jgi:hypothetical protein
VYSSAYSSARFRFGVGAIRVGRVPDVLRLAIALLLGAVAALSTGAAATASEDVVRYENGRLTVSVVDAPLDRVLAQIAAVTQATVRGGVTPRTVSIDFKDMPLAKGLTRIFGAESFMLTYGSDGALRTIAMLGQGTAVAPPAPTAPSASPQAAVAEAEDQAAVLQRPVPVAGQLAAAVGSPEPAAGVLLHAVLRETNPEVRAAARQALIEAFTRDPEIERAYLSTLAPVENATLATMLATMGPGGAAQEWMALLSGRAPSMPLRLKATAVLTSLQRQQP